jgi:peroxiredoxin
MQSGAAGDEQKMNELFNQVNELQEKYGERLKEKISSIGINLAALQATTYLDPEKELNFVDSVTALVADMYPENTMVNEYRQQISNLKQTAIGNKAPDIQLTNPEGESVSLASLTGNYVLVDFWAAWCKPCRMENPNVVNAYQKYKDEGFQILGVSLDRNKEDWVEAIEKDNLTWHQVWDEDNEAAIKYNVNAIPANFLLNPEGEIVAKNLRGEALQEKLAEIYN